MYQTKNVRGWGPQRKIVSTIFSWVFDYCLKKKRPNDNSYTRQLLDSLIIRQCVDETLEKPKLPIINQIVETELEADTRKN